MKDSNRGRGSGHGKAGRPALDVHGIAERIVNGSTYDLSEAMVFHSEELVYGSFLPFRVRFERAEEFDGYTNALVCETTFAVDLSRGPEEAVASFDRNLETAFSRHGLLSTREEAGRRRDAIRVFNAVKAAAERVMRRKGGSMLTKKDLERIGREAEAEFGKECVCGGHEKNCKHPCKEQGSTECPIARKAGKQKPMTLSFIKKHLLMGSAFRIPAKRLQVVADRIDRKSQKYVYELRFFQRDYTKSPAETQSYETAPLRIKMRNDDWKSIAKRFDKAVEGLRFNEFPRK